MIYLKEFNTTEEYNAFVESGQMKRPNVSLVNEPFTTYYNKYFPLGVFIQHVDGTLFTEADWTSSGFSNEEANGVAVITDNARFVVAKVIPGKASYYDTDITTPIDGISSSGSKDFAGQKNTNILLSTGKSEAAAMAANYSFPNGNKGYLPALGELLEIKTFYSQFLSAMNSIGGVVINSSGPNPILSSTQGDTTYHMVMTYSFFQGSVNPYGADYYKTEQFSILPFTSLD